MRMSPVSENMHFFVDHTVHVSVDERCFRRNGQVASDQEVNGGGEVGSEKKATIGPKLVI